MVPSGRGEETPTLNQAHLTPTSSWRCTKPQERAQFVWSLKTNCHEVLRRKEVYLFPHLLPPSLQILILSPVWQR